MIARFSLGEYPTSRFCFRESEMVWRGNAGLGRGLFLEEVFCLRGIKSQWDCDTRPAQMSRTMLHRVLSQ